MTHILHLALLLLTLYAVSVAQEAAISARGRSLFITIVVLNVVFIVLAGCGLFASAITEEKEEATLGLLQMAGINPLTLLLGKLMPRLVSCLILLAVQLPFVILAVTLGGITQQQVFGAYLALATFLILVASLSLLSSVICRTTIKASILMIVVVCGLLFGPDFFLMWVNKFGDRSILLASLEPGFAWLKDASIISRLWNVLDIRFNGSVVGLQTWTNLTAGTLAILCAWLAFDFFAERQSSTPAASQAGWFRLKGHRTKRSWGMALAWKDFFFSAGGIPWLALRCIVYPLLLLFVLLGFGFDFWNSYSLRDLGSCLMVMGMVCAIIELTYISSRVFRDEIKGQTLSSLVMLPRDSILSLVIPKLLGFSLTLLPAFIYFSLGAVLNPDDFFEVVGDILSDGDAFTATAAFLVMVLVFLHLATYFSLFFRWGAVPLALGTMIFGLTCLVFVARDGGGDGMPIFFTMVGLAVTVALQFAIAEKLKDLAAA